MRASVRVAYIASRYPNGLAEGVPCAAYSRSEAEEALEAAERIVEMASGWLAAESDT